MKTDKERIAENLAFIAANPFARYPTGWIAEVQSEARATGLLPSECIGVNCKPGIDAQVTYGGDMADVF